MARHEADREDLMQEAVALVHRIELRVAGFSQLITIGFRPDSAMSVFAGQDLVYQFDSCGRLRRAFVDGFLYRSQHNTLARLERHRTETETHLLRHDLNSEELSVFRDHMLSTLRQLHETFSTQTPEIVRCVPADCDLMPSIMGTLQRILKTGEWLSSSIRRRP